MKIDIITNRAKVEVGQVYRIDNHTRFLPRGTHTTTIRVTGPSAVSVREGEGFDTLTVLDLDGIEILSAGVIS